MIRPRRRNGFSLIELLVVVAIIAVLATIAIMNYFSAIARARQKRTMADMRTIAQAWETRASEKGSYSAAGFTFPTVMTWEEVNNALSPTYTRSVPRIDGWGRPFEFGAQGKQYAIRSSGRDGVYEGNTYQTGAGENPDCDIVFANGNFVRYPETIQND